MKFVCLLILFVAIGHGTVQAASKADPLVTGLTLSRFEIQDPTGDNIQYLEGVAYLRRDGYSISTNVEMEREAGQTHELELQLLYGLPIAPYWDVSAGIRTDLKPTPQRTWGVLGFNGMAPGFVEVEAYLFVGESERTSLRVELEREFPITDYWTLLPEVEINIYGQTDEVTGAGSGLSSVETSVLLRYEWLPAISPYIGVTFSKLFGETADIHAEEGGNSTNTNAVIGISLFF